MGLYMGAVDCLATLNIIQTFEERVAPFLQDCSFVIAEHNNETSSLLPAVAGVLFSNDSDVTEADSLQGAQQHSGGTFALGRLLSIFIATRYHPAHMLLASLVGTLTSTVVMLALPHDRVSIYIGTCIFGLFLSSTSPTIISLTEQYIDLNSK
ncbi:hypothetical protein NP493_248g03012 [Ridgeia piscesae]|uniref:Uncharacterized protein n=1 Tax=Ridgeia piscesae TaxID=27915 RepID=A0AAD9UD79_RIDPI|nr:hypothetical protein NP493_248g03012 [Ridgeia piscesae]